MEVLRTTPNQVELKVCRPPPDVLSSVSPISEVPPPPPRRDPPNSLNLTNSVYGTTPEDDYYHGVSRALKTKLRTYIKVFLYYYFHHQLIQKIDTICDNQINFWNMVN